MIQIQGIKGNLSVTELTKVSDLIYFDGPFLSHYMHKSGDNYLSYWVDCDDKAQRWLVFRIGITSLQQYVDKKCSLLDIIRQLDEGFVYLVDVDGEGHATQPLIVFLDKLPNDYFPETDSYYDFSLERESDVESLSLANNCGLFEIHFTGTEVRYGNMPFDKFSKCLQKIEDLRLCCANSFVKKAKGTDTYKQLKPETKSKFLDELRLNTNFQYVYSLAGSVRVLLRPQNLQASFEQTSADDFAKELIRLFKSGFDVAKLREYAREYGQETLMKFNDLLDLLRKTNVDLEISWTNTKQNVYAGQKIYKTDKKMILDNLAQTIETSQELSFKGRFYSLNTKNGKFSFESIGDDVLKIEGKFDENLIGTIPSLTFEQTYEITIERKITNGLTRSQKVNNTIIDIKAI